MQTLRRTLANPASLAVIAILLLALGARLLPGARTIDDSFITFRYARNILAGNGFSYNPGERVLGTTTPLYTILLAGLAALSGGVQAPFPNIALVVNALADALTCLLLIRLGSRLGSPRAGYAAALAWALAPFSVTFAIGGLETSLYILLLTGMVSAHLEQRRKRAALLAALALLTRPDALILIGPLVLDRLWLLVRRRSAAQNRLPALTGEFLAFALPVIPWLVFATLQFGSPLPHSIAAKTLAYHLPANAAFIRLLQHYATPFLDHLTFGVPAIAVGMVLYPALFVIGAWHALKTQPRAWAFAAYPWLYFATFTIANPLIFRWYLTPPLPAYFLFILMGLDRLLQALPAKPALSSRRIPIGAALGALVFAVPALLMLQDWQVHPDHGLPHPAPEMAWYQLELYYRQAAGELLPDIQASTDTPLLAAGDVGVLGYFTGARILDTVGLNSSVSTGYYPLPEAMYVTNYAVPPDLILDQQPDYVVIMEVYGRNGLLKDERFLQAYRLRRKIPTDIYTSDGMLIFERNK